MIVGNTWQLNHFTWWQRGGRFVDHCNETFQFSLQRFKGVVRARILKHVAHQITKHHLVVRFFGARFQKFGGFFAIRGQQEGDCDKISLERQAHFENLR